MKKVLLSMLALCMSVSMFGATKTIYCALSSQAASWFLADGACVGVHYWGGTNGSTFPGIRMTAVEGETNLYSAEIDDSNTNVLFIRLSGSGDIANWGAQTNDLTAWDSGNNLFTISSESACWSGSGCKLAGSWSTYTPAASTDPAVALTVTGNAELGSEVTLSAAASNIEGEVSYKYYVKVGDGEFTALEADKYTFEAFGTYTFKVEALVGTDVKAESTKAVTVKADWYVKGTFNNWKSQPEYGMKKNAEGVYSLSFKLEAGTYEFKLNGSSWIAAKAVSSDCSDQGWEGKDDDNIKFTLGAEATVTVTYDGAKICLTSTLGQFGKVVITSYTIVGDNAIVGADWVTDNTNADMTDKGNGTWAWEIKDRVLEATDYNYKVVGNHAYAVYQYPAGENNNKTLTIAEAGTYDIVYTFKPGETPELSAVATKHSSPVTGLQESVAPLLYTRDGRIYGAEDMRIYTVLGLDVTNMNGQLNGIYVVKTQAGIVKVVVR